MGGHPCASALTCVYACEAQRTMSIIFCYLSPLFFRQGLSMNLKISASANWAGQGTSGVWPSLLPTALVIK